MKKELRALLDDVRRLVDRNDKWEEILRRDRLECNVIIQNHLAEIDRQRATVEKLEQTRAELQDKITQLRKRRRKRK